MSNATTNTIHFQGTTAAIGGVTIVRLPEQASKRLRSRGQVAVRGTINGRAFETVLEPDGYFGHWMRIDRELQRAASLNPGAAVDVEIEERDDWPEPAVPRDLQRALRAADAGIQQLWREITPMARWEWVRWVNATNNPATRERRVEVTIAKMQSGKRRPCCFNLAGCTDPELSQSGRLRA